MNLYLLLQYLYLFMIGALAGWILELLWRRVMSARRWVNPGFLDGPYLPIYGFAVVLLYILSRLDLTLWIRLPLFLVTTTLLELLVGEFLLNYFQVRLWNYSGEFLNFHGLICPRYSLYWLVLSFLFEQFFYPFFRDRVEFLFTHLEFSFFVGIFYGVLLVDLARTFNLAGQIRKIVLESENKIRVDYERIKVDLRERMIEFRIKNLFFQPFRLRYTKHFHQAISAQQERIQKRLEGSSLLGRVKKNHPGRRRDG